MKWILRYLRGAFKKCLCFDNGKPMFDGYIYAYMSSDVDIKKSTSRYMMTFARRNISW